jgi:hypothetical protein
LGANVVLNCKAQGYPKPSIAWIRADGKPLFDGTIIHYVFISIIWLFNSKNLSSNRLYILE